MLWSESIQIFVSKKGILNSLLDETGSQCNDLKANFQSAEFSERAEFETIKSCSAVTIYSISQRHFLPQTMEFPPARKIPLTGNQP